MPDRGTVGLDISSDFAELLAEMTRQDPGSARVFVNDEIVTLVVTESLTDTERQLALKDGDEVRAHRRRLQSAVCARLADIVADASGRGTRRVSLETGSMAFFAPARALYAKYGFVECGPFGRYVSDPNSIFMTRAL